MSDFQKLKSGLRLAWVVSGLLSCAVADSHPDAMTQINKKSLPPPPSAPPSASPDGRGQAANLQGQSAITGPRPSNECGNAQVGAIGPAPDFSLTNARYTPKISMSTGFVTHLHKDDPTALQHLLVKPQGQFAELWYVAEQRWQDQAGTCIKYCVFPRIEVTGLEKWAPLQWSSSGSPGPRPAPILTLNIGGVINTITLDTALESGASFELPHSDNWCKVAPASARPRVVLSVEGYERGVTVDFGNAPKQPPRGVPIDIPPGSQTR